MASPTGNATPPRTFPHFAQHFLVAVLAVVAATLVRLLLDAWVAERVVFMTYFVAIAFTAWYGGVWLGALTAAMSYWVADYFFLPPRHALTILDWNREIFGSVVAYSLISVTILLLADVLTRANARSEAEAQRANEQRNLLEVTLASIGDAVIVTDVERRITFMNGVAETLTGWTRTAAIGLPLERVFCIENEFSGEAIEAPIAQVLKTGVIVGLANHTVLVGKDGTRRPIDDSAAPILDESGQVLGVVLVFRDVSEQRHAQQAQQQLAAIVEHSEDAVIGKNMSGIITSWNAAAERLYGYTAAEAIGQPIRVIVPSDHRDELEEIMRRLKAGERIDAWDTVRMRKDGTRVDVSLQISPIKNSEGEVIGASKVARDVTSRKRDEESLAVLAEASQSLAALTDRQSTLEQVARVSVPFFADWCVVYCLDENDSMVPRAHAHANPLKDAVLAELLERKPVSKDPATPTARAYESGRPQLVESLTDDMLLELGRDEPARRKLGELNPRSLISVPLVIRGRTIGVVTFVLSGASRAYHVRDLHFAMELAGRAATAIDNAQLFHSVQEAVRQKDDFLAMLSHELRNPLAAISYATSLGQLSTAGEQAEVFPVIERQVQHLTHLIDDLLDVARISRHKINLKLEPIDLGTIVRHAANSAQHLFDEKRHEFTVDVAGEPMPIMVDVTRAEQVVVNLLSNAAKYTPVDGQVSLRAYPENGSAVVSVRDSGIGLSAEMIPKVFELFSQADRTLDRSEGGLGVGLTIVRQLVEMLGGNVSAASAGVGQGAEFVVRFPLSDVPVPDEPTSPAATKTCAGKPRILVVDDNFDTARISAMLLRNQGYEVETAHDGQAAFDLALSSRPDVALLDIGLPRMNGYEVAQALRKQGFTGKLIAVSGYGQSEDRRRSREAGFDHHLVKPVDHHQLFELIGSPNSAV
jgi:PAS domain S-box-containing protein